MQNPAVISFWQKKLPHFVQVTKKTIGDVWCIDLRKNNDLQWILNCIIHRSIGPWPEILSYPQDSIVDLGKIGSTWLRFLSANTYWSFCNNLTRHPLHEHKNSGKNMNPKSIHRFETSTLALHSPPDFGNVDCLPSWQGKWVRVVIPMQRVWISYDFEWHKTC